MINEEEQANNVVDIVPLKRGRRILVFLADFFINFIFTFVLFNTIVMPLSNVITNSTYRQNKNDAAAKEQFNILYDEKVMFFEKDGEKYYYTKNVETTLNCYLSYYSFNDTDVLADHPLYGNKAENEVLFHFYKDIRNNYQTYVTTIERFNKEHDFFVINGENISLRDVIKDNIRLSFFSEGDMSEEGKKALGYLQDFFINCYADLFKDIEKNDLKHEGKSYLYYKSIVSQCENEMQVQLIISSVIAFVLGSAIYYLVIPMLSKENKTLSMMMMRVVRIGTNNLYLLKKSESFLLLVYSLIFNLPILFFMPMTYVAFTYLFNIVPLTSSLFIGLLLWLVSFAVSFISPLGQFLTDFLSRSVLISDSDLDAIYRSKGYNI